MTYDPHQARLIVEQLKCFTLPRIMVGGKSAPTLSWIVKMSADTGYSDDIESRVAQIRRQLRSVGVNESDIDNYYPLPPNTDEEFWVSRQDFATSHSQEEVAHKFPIAEDAVRLMHYPAMHSNVLSLFSTKISPLDWLAHIKDIFPEPVLKTLAHLAIQRSTEISG